MTTTELSTSPEILPYLERLEQRLVNLPDDERTDLLSDLESHLEEILSDESEAPLIDRIGTPNAYADEFAESIGLDDTGQPAPSMSEAVFAAIRDAIDHPMAERSRRLWSEMRPAWWTLRGLAIGLFVSWNYLGPGDPGTRWVFQLLAGVVVLAGIGVSMRIGRNRDRSRGWSWASHFVTIAGLLAGLALMANVSARMSASYYPYTVTELDQQHLIEVGTFDPPTSIPFDPPPIITP